MDHDRHVSSMLRTPDGKIDLGHRALYIRGTPGQSFVIAAGRDGSYSVIPPTLREVRRYFHRTGIRAVSPHPIDQRMALVDDQSGAAMIQAFDGSQRRVVAAPEVRSGTPQWVKPGFGDCLFDSSGETVWLTAPLSEGSCNILLVDAASGALIAQEFIVDPFGGSFCRLQPTGRRGLLSLWVAAGQDGQQLYWIERGANGISCRLEPCLSNTTPPSFAPSGRFFLVVDEERAIHRFDFPSMALVGNPIETGDDDNVFAESVEFLNERQALAGTTEGRIFVIDTDQMRIEA